jgi:hypothetical protein
MDLIDLNLVNLAEALENWVAWLAHQAPVQKALAAAQPEVRVQPRRE